MAYIKIEVDNKVLATTDWSTFRPSPDSHFPRIYRMNDGNYVVFWNNISCGIYIDRASGDAIMLNVEKDTKTSEPAPNAGISGHTLLWAIALAQDPTLIRTMEK